MAKCYQICLYKTQPDANTLLIRDLRTGYLTDSRDKLKIETDLCNSQHLKERVAMLNQPEQQGGGVLRGQPINSSDPRRRPPAPSEMFGPFGPSDWSPGEEFEPSDAPPVAMADEFEQPVQHALPMPSPSAITFPAPPHGYPPVAPAPAAAGKKPIYFPLTRGATAPLQIFGMLGYSLLLAISIMGIVLYLLSAYHPGLSIFINIDGSTNSLAVLLIAILALLVVPACSLLSGAFFGGWRGLLVSLIAVGGGIALAHLSNAQFFPNPISLQPYLELAPLPVSALIVGLIYDHRKYASWGKSLSTLLLGSAIICTWFFAFLFISSANSPNLASAASSASVTPQNLLASIGISPAASPSWPFRCWPSPWPRSRGLSIIGSPPRRASVKECSYVTCHRCQ